MINEIDPEAKWLLGSQQELQVGLTEEHTVAVCKSELRELVISYLDDYSIIDSDWNELSPEQQGKLADASFSALINGSPQVFEYELEQDFGPYPAFIRGVLGCYFLDVLERDPIGPFADLDLAKKAFEFGFGELKTKKRSRR